MHIIAAPVAQLVEHVAQRLSPQQRLCLIPAYGPLLRVFLPLPRPFPFYPQAVQSIKLKK